MELARKNQLGEAQTHLQKAVELYPRYAVAWYELGRVQLAQHTPEGARQSFDESITLCFQSTTAHPGVAREVPYLSVNAGGIGAEVIRSVD